MPSLAQQSLMLTALEGDMDRSFPLAAQAFREEARVNPEKWRWAIENANKRPDHTLASTKGDDYV